MIVTNDPRLAPVSAFHDPQEELSDLRTRLGDITDRLEAAKKSQARLTRELAICTDEVNYQQSAADNCKRRIDEIIDTFGDS